ncbi:hypothetical protein V7S43_004643 [Phytophthora oleae]|uniref:Uncharacterized protein n=1 Tax=Phytophthora oleae TaxID=2107226 RepID=A0ABD3FVD1_9STRA
MLAIEDMKKLQKEQHRVTMVIFRKKKKETIQKQQQECRRLEREIKLFVKTARAKVACISVGDSKRASTSTVIKLQKAVVDWKTLSRENRALHDEIERREGFEQAVRKPNQAAIDAETLLLLPVDSQSGHRVCFDHEEPSFHFYPFTKAGFDTGVRNFEAELTKGIQSVSMIGNILGWDVYRAPLVTNDNSVLQRVQLAKRMCYPLDDLL